MDFEEWYSKTEIGRKKQKAKERREQKMDLNWQRVTEQAKKKKLTNKKSKRDIEREVRIQELGGTPIQVEYGKPLSDFIRGKRLEVEWDLKYPERKEKKRVDKEKLKSLKKYNRSGSRRTEVDFLKSTLKTAKIRSDKQGIPFDLHWEDFKVPRHCPVLGIELFWSDKLTNNTPSFDRLVPEKGYVLDNVRIISMRANRLKNNATVEEMEKILFYMKGHEEPTEKLEEGPTEG